MWISWWGLRSKCLDFWLHDKNRQYFVSHGVFTDVIQWYLHSYLCLQKNTQLSWNYKYLRKWPVLMLKVLVEVSSSREMESAHLWRASVLRQQPAPGFCCPAVWGPSELVMVSSNSICLKKKKKKVKFYITLLWQWSSICAIHWLTGDSALCKLFRIAFTDMVPYINKTQQWNSLYMSTTKWCKTM